MEHGGTTAKCWSVVIFTFLCVVLHCKHTKENRKQRTKTRREKDEKEKEKK